ncbi:eosinophil peroxidase [Lepisosteus oculatus]|uniref:eosinophil peroxidase n=1 Tax=Lepisosteus oculatus TaxID=7918 RepID=UPI0035F51951
MIFLVLLILRLAVTFDLPLPAAVDIPSHLPPAGGARPGSHFVAEALRRAGELIDAAYTHTGERMKVSLTQGSVQPSDLLSLFKQPGPETQAQVQAAEFLENTVELIREMVYTQGLQASNLTHISEMLSTQDMETVAEATGCLSELQPLQCETDCLSDRYRSITGECNNRKHPRWGAANTPYARWLPAQYEDGRSAPRSWDPQHRYNGHPLPPVRQVSQLVLHTPNEEISLDSLTQVLVEWGQWIDHDLDLTPQSGSTADFLSGADCAHTCSQNSPCFPIKVPLSDPRSSLEGCLPFFRSAPSCTPGGPDGVAPVTPWPREQLNAITAFVDASMVYGSAPSLAAQLRDRGSPQGLLTVNARVSDLGRPLLPFLPRPPGLPDACAPPSAPRNGSSCFMAGDSRANEHLGMLALHTLFLREHNRLGLALHELNPHWSPGTLYQEARKIVGAIHQVLTWDQYLPRILGREAHQRLLPVYAGYSEQTDPRIANVFATAAFRFAHVTVQPVVLRLDDNYAPSSAHPSLLLHQSLFSSWRIIKEGGIAPVLRGMLVARAKLQTPSQMMVEELTERLFQAQGGLALDLGALNLQRGRDHGLPGYGVWRHLCGLSVPLNETELARVLGSATLSRKLLSLYGTPENVDVWVGAIAEPALPGGRVGPLLACLLGRQFRALRDGDRFWWQKEDVFTAAQRAELHKASLSRIICDNTDITRVPADVFTHGALLPCGHSSIARLNLSAWREEDTDPHCGAVPRLAHGFSLRCGAAVLYECRRGYQLRGSPSVTCDPHSGQWRPAPPACQDIDECASFPAPCPPSDTCVNTPGSHLCTGEPSPLPVRQPGRSSLLPPVTASPSSSSLRQGDGPLAPCDLRGRRGDGSDGRRGSAVAGGHMLQEGWQETTAYDWWMLRKGGGAENCPIPRRGRTHH